MQMGFLPMGIHHTKLNKLHSFNSHIKHIEFQHLKHTWRRFRRKPLPSSNIGDQEKPCTVINLSGITFSNDEINLLSMGLSFCSFPHRANRDEILDDLESYFRLLHLKEFFLDEDEINDAAPRSLFHPPSSWMPTKGGDVALETYIR